MNIETSNLEQLVKLLRRFLRMLPPYLRSPLYGVLPEMNSGSAWNAMLNQRQSCQNSSLSAN
jgi:hypothetical protein